MVFLERIYACFCHASEGVDSLRSPQFNFRVKMSCGCAAVLSLGSYNSSSLQRAIQDSSSCDMSSPTLSFLWQALVLASGPIPFRAVNLKAVLNIWQLLSGVKTVPNVEFTSLDHAFMSTTIFKLFEAQLFMCQCKIFVMKVFDHMHKSKKRV